MSKDVSNSAIRQQFVEAYAKTGNKKNLEEVMVGNNGYAIGQSFTCTGALKVIEREINGSKAAWVAVETEEGVDVSIKALMNISSLQGYELDGEFETVSLDKNKEVTNKVEAKVIENFDFSMVGQPTTRNLLDFIGEADENQLFKGVQITYLGQAVRPFEAKKDHLTGIGEKYKAGAKRAIVQKLWGYSL